MNDQTADDVQRLVALFARCMGGFDDQMALQVEDQIRGEFGGASVYIARERWSDKRGRDESIRAAAAAGRSIGWIAHRYVLSRTQVWRILAEGTQRAEGSDA
jgi:Mor family transcriptional regulator